ncbi:MAG: 3-hydroxyacyl-ACP dehydratase FabZ [Actinomycetota bacterium]
MSSLSLRPEDWLPHRAPFLLLDEMIEIVPGERATARWTLGPDEPFFAGHFPGRPITPGVLLLESIAQCGAVAVLADSRYSRKLPLFAGVEKARFRKSVLPGDTVTLECEMLRLSARGGTGRGRALLNGVLAVQAEIMFVVVDSE